MEEIEYVFDILQATMSCLTVVHEAESSKKRKRSIWSRQSLLNRQKHSAHITVVGDLRRKEPSAFKIFMRMNEDTFEDLLKTVAPAITKQDTNFREAITTEERLIVTLRYLASGMSYADLESYHKIGKSTISLIVPEVCEAIYDACHLDYLRVPNSPGQWLTIAEEFESKWNFPHCVGALDGKHITIQKPHNSGSEYYNYKKFCSVILLALIDADYKFLFVDIGTNGRVSDGAVFQSSGLASALRTNAFNFPEDTPIEGITGNIPYMIVADDAFPIKTYITKPYPQRNLTIKKRLFNYRCSRARRISENAFGILVSRFRILQRPIQLEPKKVEKVILACVSLHNYLRSRLDESYFQADLVDRETLVEHNIIQGSWRSEENHTTENSLSTQGGNHSSKTALEIRDKLAEYFSQWARYHGNGRWFSVVKNNTCINKMVTTLS